MYVMPDAANIKFYSGDSDSLCLNHAESQESHGLNDIYHTQESNGSNSGGLMNGACDIDRFSWETRNGERELEKEIPIYRRNIARLRNKRAEWMDARS